MKAGYGLNVESKVVLFKGFPEGALFGSPLHKVFLHPRLVSSVADTSWLASGQDALDGGFISRGVATPEGLDSGGSPALVGVASVGSPFLLFCGDVQRDFSMLVFSCRRSSGGPL